MLRYKPVVLIIAIIFSVYEHSQGGVVIGKEQQKNDTRPFTIHVMRLLCVDMPYVETTVHECRVILRRNQRSLMSVSVYVPKLYNYLLLQVRLYYKFTTYQPLLLDVDFEGCSYVRQPVNDRNIDYFYRMLYNLLPGMVYPCPHGVSVIALQNIVLLKKSLQFYDLQNRTYTALTEFKEEYAPKSIPAGEYRFDLRIASRVNVTLLRLQTYFTVRRRGILGSMLEW